MDWIKDTEENKPNTWIEVIVCDKYGETTSGYWNDDNGHWYDLKNDILKNVVYWTRLPFPPKELIDKLN